MNLYDRWVDLWQRLGATGNPVAIFQQLQARYSESHRAYHTLAHLEHCFQELDQVRDTISNPELVELIIWWHDVVYDPRRGDNETTSAKLLLDLLSNTNIDPELLKQAARGVEVTAHSETVPDDTDLQTVLDIDLAILGQQEPRYHAYREEIRQEYSFVPLPEYASGRVRILQSFLDRPSIYRTNHFRDRYEEAARHNLGVEILSLRFSFDFKTP